MKNGAAGEDLAARFKTMINPRSKTNMKSIKYLILGLAFGLASFLPAAAQAPHRSQSFLNVQAVVLTNTWNPTNLLTTGSVGTNIIGLIYTNDSARVVVSSSTSSNNAVTRKNPFKDVELWACTDGRGAWSEGSTNGLGILYNQSFATISVTMTNGSGANTAIPFVFTPLYNGRNEATAAAEQWTATFTPTASSVQTLATNVPLYRWPGAAGLRLRWAANPDTDADGQVTILDLSLNGFKP